MASVKPNLNKDGAIISYRFRACIGRDEKGKQIFSSKTVAPPADLTPAKALKKMQTEADLWEEALKKGYAPVKKLSFQRFIEEQFIPVHVCNGKHSPSTVFFYKSICLRLVEQFGKKQLDSIKALDIEKYLNSLQLTYTANYIHHFRTVLAVAFGFAEKHDLIERNPMRKVSCIKTDRTTVDFLNENEARRFLQLLEAEADTYWSLAMNTMILLGLRRGELCGLQWGDIDFEESQMTICRDVITNKETGNKPLVKQTKSANSDRSLPIPSTLLMLFRKWRKEQADQYGILMPSAFVFNNLQNAYQPIRPDSVTRWLYRFNKKHGLRQVSPHDLRHTAGTLLLSSGASVKEVQNILGHYDASVTLRYYCGTDMDALKNASTRLADLLSANGS